ncbi:peptidase M14 [Polaribacter pacificus]|uniref:Peptidase M14 n=1 Tax=Polaribacter pacificus TaxID=1775173 RepID=A0A917MED8_9FLAO|nr:M14 family zinc carboxypeptidase [Polaribacter pacificus]GGG98502.1 peptidase M14 [Polaribacter pacificus]
MHTLPVAFVETLFKQHKESSLFGRWIHAADLDPVLKKLASQTKVQQIGSSEDGLPIHSIKLGTGAKKILLWSQMHGNESTGTKALIDFIKSLLDATDPVIDAILKECTLLCIPMLNPDGALAYTRVNDRNVDLNRDAIDLKAKESKLLRGVLDDFNPVFCFNLHDQRTIFGVSGTQNPASISFLAPSEDIDRTLTKGRKETMNVIIAMNTLLQQIIPGHVGRYTDEFYPTATGDVFQQLGFNTVLIEAGHYPDDYERELVRKFNFFALLQGVFHIAMNQDFSKYEAYFEIPDNNKNFVDILEIDTEKGTKQAFQYVEEIVNGAFQLKKTPFEVADIDKIFAHQKKYRNN